MDNVFPFRLYVTSESLLPCYVRFSAPLASAPVWTRKFNSQEELITEFVRECRIVRKGMLDCHSISKVFSTLAKVHQGLIIYFLLTHS